MMNREKLLERILSGDIEYDFNGYATEQDYLRITSFIRIVYKDRCSWVREHPEKYTNHRAMSQKMLKSA